MGSFRTSLGQEYVIERRLPRLGWKPDLRDTPDGGDLLDVVGLGGDDLGALAIFGLILLAVLLVLIVAPLLLFVAEVALLVAVVVPVMILAVAVGLKQHLVILRTPDGKVLDQRSVHGVIGTVRAGRALKSAALSGAYPL